MDLVQVVVALIVIGVLLGLLNKFGAEWVAPPMMRIINAVVVIAVVLWLLALFTGWSGLPRIQVGR
jgi:ABC-type dipeptide/oligopeptide/nickel transport system permease subunit